MSLGLEGALEEQAHPQAGHLLEDLAQVLVGGEQLVDVGGDARWGILVVTRVWVSFLCLSGWKGTYARLLYTAEGTPPPDDVRSLTAIEIGLPGFGLESLADVTHGGTWRIGVLAPWDPRNAPQWVTRGNRTVRLSGNERRPRERSPTLTSMSSSVLTRVPMARAGRSASTSPCSKKATKSQPSSREPEAEHPGTGNRSMGAAEFTSRSGQSHVTSGIRSDQ